MYPLSSVQKQVRLSAESLVSTNERPCPSLGLSQAKGKLNNVLLTELKGRDDIPLLQSGKK
jgi:hypothetical protein